MNSISRQKRPYQDISNPSSSSKTPRSSTSYNKRYYPTLLPITSFANDIQTTPLSSSALPSSSYTPLQLPYAFFIPNDMIGFLIGSGGCSVRQIESISSATLHFEKSSSKLAATTHHHSTNSHTTKDDAYYKQNSTYDVENEKLLTLHGNKESKAIAIDMILKRILSMEPVKSTDTNIDVIACTIAVPSNSIALLIGNKGTTINRLSQQSNCPITVRKDTVQRNDVRAVTLKCNNIESIISCILSIYELFEELIGAQKLQLSEFYILKEDKPLLHALENKYKAHDGSYGNGMYQYGAPHSSVGGDLPPMTASYYEGGTPRHYGGQSQPSSPIALSRNYTMEDSVPYEHPSSNAYAPQGDPYHRPVSRMNEVGHHIATHVGAPVVGEAYSRLPIRNGSSSNTEYSQPSDVHRSMSSSSAAMMSMHQPPYAPDRVDCVSLPQPYSVLSMNKDIGDTPQSYGDAYSFKFVISSDLAAWIVGKGGEHIRDIKRNSDATIEVSNSRSSIPGLSPSDRLVTVHGTFASQHKALHMLIVPMLQKFGGTEKNLKVLVPLNAVSLIIGQKGMTINRITAETTADVNIEKKMELVDGERLVTIGGTPHAQFAACMSLFEKVEEHLEGGSSSNYSTVGGYTQGERGYISGSYKMNRYQNAGY